MIVLPVWNAVFVSLARGLSPPFLPESKRRCLAPAEASSAENGAFVEHSPAHTPYVENSISYCTAYVNKGIQELKIFVAIITLVY